MRHILSFLFISILLLVTLLAAQEAPQVGNVRLSRFGDLLREHNIQLTEPALLRALKNPDADVRFLAAMKLEEDHAVDAIPAIRAALAGEKDPRARVNIALALGLLGDQTGSVELRRVCADRSFVPEFRLYAARYTFDLHSQNEDCLGAAEETLESEKFADRISALELLPRFQDLTPKQSQEVLNLVLSRLKDPEPVVQMAASHALASLGNPSAINDLEAAMDREQDQAVRSVFETDLKKLKETAKQ